MPSQKPLGADGYLFELKDGDDFSSFVILW